MYNSVYLRDVKCPINIGQGSKLFTKICTNWLSLMRWLYFHSCILQYLDVIIQN